MPLRTLSLLIVISLLAVALVANAAVIRVPGDQPTIKQGIAAASEGDTVLVADGTYTGALNRGIDFNGVNMTLMSESGYSNTLIGCGNFDRAFYFASHEDSTSVVRGFVIQDGLADNGGAVVCANASSPRFEDCVFQQNRATDTGGAVLCVDASNPIFRGCTFGGNLASGGLSPRGGAAACLFSSNAVFSGCSFTGNTAGALGGAIHCQDSSPSVRHCSFTFNDATGTGGGAIFAMSASAPEVESCTFVGNTASDHGGAIYGDGSPVSVTDCLFYLNESASAGGAVTFLYPLSTAQFTNCTFSGNHAQIGGVLYCYDSANVTFANCTFLSNTATVDGALVVANEASPVFTRSIVTDSDGDPLVYCGGTAAPVFSKVVLYDNSPNDDLCGSVSDTLHRDPLFCDAAGFDWTLCEDSVCAPANNAWSELIGAKPVGCAACGTSVEPTTWGSIKAMFR